MNFIKVILIGILFTALKVNAGQSFLDFKVNSEIQDVKLYLNASNGRPFGQFKLLDKHLKENNQKLIFAMNAGIFMENLFPLGLYVENGVLIKKINLRKHAYGNFYMQPNGVFSIKNNGAYIDSSFKYKKMMSCMQLSQGQC